MNRFAMGFAPVCAGLLLLFAASQASAAAIASITYTVSFGTATGPVNTVAVRPGTAVTFTPAAGSLPYGTTGIGGVLAVSTLYFATPLNLGLNSITFFTPQPFPLVYSAAPSSYGPVYVGWAAILPTLAGNATLTTPAALNFTVSLPLVANFTVALNLGNEVRTTVPEPTKGTLLGMAGFALLGAGVGGRRFAVRARRARIQ